MQQVPWYILRVSPGTETEVCGAIFPLPTYVPIRTVKRFNRRQRVTITTSEVLYPGYVFAQIDDLTAFRSFPCSPILGFLRAGDKTYAKLDDQDMEAIRVIVAKVVVEKKTAVLAHRFTVTQKVSLLSNQSVSLPAIIKRLIGTEDLLVEVDILGRTNEVRVKASQVELARAS